MSITKEQLAEQISDAFKASLPESVPADARQAIEAKYDTTSIGIADAIEGFVLGRRTTFILSAQNLYTMLSAMLSPHDNDSTYLNVYNESDELLDPKEFAKIYSFDVLRLFTPDINESITLTGELT
jgi:hypothetical protein